MAYTPRTGITGTATLNSTELPIVGWTCDPMSEIQVYKNSLTGNHPIKAGTFVDARISIDTDWDDSNQPFASPLLIIPGLVIANVRLRYDGTAGSLYWNFSSCIVQDTPISYTRAGKFLTKINLQGNGGLFTAPGGVAF